MKKKTLWAVVAATAAVSGSAYAEGYNRAGISYELETMYPKHGDNLNLNGFGLNYIHGFGVSSKLPLFVETGAKFSAVFGSIEEKDMGYTYKTDYQVMSLAVPVNVAYRFSFADGTMGIAPYLGLNFKFNLLAKGKEGGESYNLFDKDVWDANRFQMGWHVGAVYNWNSIYAGLSFGTDFIEIAEDVATSTFNITVGYNF